MNKKLDTGFKVNKKFLGVGLGLGAVIPACAQTGKLDTLATTIESVTTSAGTVMGAIAALVVAITVGVIVIKMAKKPRSAS
ncbi:MAG: hypothetical protein MJY99_08815 [Fibrobacter sp.]|nr:hypothetical protein [Fibrobacter sp.]